MGANFSHEEAIQHFKKMIEMDPTFPWAHSHLGRIYMLKGDLAASAEERATSLELDGRPDLARGVRESFAKGGWNGIQQFMAENNPTDSFYWGITTMQNKEKWLTLLEKHARLGNFWLFLIKIDPTFNELRSEPRFQALVHKYDPPTG
jgi:tetratricopeptide (TPR) repeat protein